MTYKMTFRKPSDQRRSIGITLRLTPVEYQEVKSIAQKLNIPISEVWRRFYETVRVLYDGRLTLGDALRYDQRTSQIHKLLERNGDIPLSEAIRPIPELIKIVQAKTLIETIKRRGEGWATQLK